MTTIVSIPPTPITGRRRRFRSWTAISSTGLPLRGDEEFPKGAHLFTRGERSVDFFVVVEGSIEITDAGTGGQESVIHVHRARQFTGELDLFNNREILVSGVTGEDSRIIRVPRSRFTRLIEAEPDIGEIIMRAFILRRVGLMRYSQGGVVLIGSSHSGDTLRISAFCPETATRIACSTPIRIRMRAA
jgi:thioredoxin reductase (NADPH)